MGMSRSKKTIEYNEIRERFESDELMVVAHNLGLTVKENSALRNKGRPEGVRIKTTKNTLARRALAGTRFEGVADLFKGPTMIASSSDPIAAAKVAHDFAKTNPKFVILGGAFGEKALSRADVEHLANLPPLDSLRGKLVGLLQAPATKLAGLLQAPARDLVGVTRAYGEKAA